MTPIAMPWPDFPDRIHGKIEVDTVCMRGGCNKTDPTSSRKEIEKIKIVPARQCGQSSDATMRLSGGILRRVKKFHEDRATVKRQPTRETVA
ncbi:MAG: hypothetical protein ACREQO_22905 [Candidatus Binatia bacterium]